MTYYRFVNPDRMKGDLTKNCGLDGTEIDANFWELEGNEIVSLTFEHDNIIIRTYSGKMFSCSLYKGTERNMRFFFDKERGVLVIKSEGHEDRFIPGFMTEHEVRRIFGMEFPLRFDHRNAHDVVDVNADGSTIEITRYNGEKETVLDNNATTEFVIDTFDERNANDVVDVTADGSTIEITRYNGEKKTVLDNNATTEFVTDTFDERNANDVVDLYKTEENTLEMSRYNGQKDTVLKDLVSKTEVNDIATEKARVAMEEAERVIEAAVQEQIRHMFTRQMFFIENKIKEGFKHMNVYTDMTLRGRGGIMHPLGISKMYRTGVYRAVDFMGDELPETMNIGDRYLIRNNLSSYGYLYNLNGVKRIAQMLADANSEWRVASVEDWDLMLNALEPDPADRNHAAHPSSKWNGKVAGSRIKVRDRRIPNWTGGPINGFDAYPAGGALMLNGTTPTFVKERYDVGDTTNGYAFAIWWTMDNINPNESVTKAIYDDKDVEEKGKVMTERRNETDYYPIRLVKKFNGKNFKVNENILGVDTPCVIMPTMKKTVVGNDNGTENQNNCTCGCCTDDSDFEYEVWTSVNVAIAPTEAVADQNGEIVDAPEGKFHFTFPEDEDLRTNYYFIYEVNGNMTLSCNRLEEYEGVYVNTADINDGGCMELRILYRGNLVHEGVTTQELQRILNDGGVFDLPNNASVNANTMLSATADTTINLGNNTIVSDGSDGLDAALIVEGANISVEINAE